MNARLLTAAFLLALCAGVARSEALAPLDLEELHGQAADYRRRAALLRKSAGLRGQSISDAQRRADQIIQGAQADALLKQQQALQGQAQAQSNNEILGLAAGLLPGGNSMLKSAVKTGLLGAGQVGMIAAEMNAQGASLEGSTSVSQAHQAAAPLREQAKALEGDRKKLALKADQYEKLADAKDLLIAAETLRLRAESAPASAAESDKELSDSRRFLESMDLW